MVYLTRDDALSLRENSPQNNNFSFMKQRDN